MSLLMVEGWDYYGANQNPANQGKWGTIISGIDLNPRTERSRTGTLSARASSSSYNAITKPFTVGAGVAAIVGIAVYMEQVSSESTTFNLIEVREGTTVHMSVMVLATGQLRLRRGSTTVATTSVPWLVLNTFACVEFKTVIDGSAGTYEVHVDGVQVTELTATGQNTKNGGTGVWDRILIAGPSANAFLDDFYLADSTGSAPLNTFLGPVKIEMLLPQTDAVAAGSNNGLTPSTGTDHGALVDDLPFNTTDYNSSPTVGVKDTYNYPSMTLSGTILAVQTNMYVSKSDATARQVCPVIRTDADYDGTSISPTTSFQYSHQVWPTQPQSGTPAWTASAVNSMQAGMKVTV